MAFTLAPGRNTFGVVWGSSMILKIGQNVRVATMEDLRETIRYRCPQTWAETPDGGGIVVDITAAAARKMFRAAQTNNWELRAMLGITPWSRGNPKTTVLLTFRR